VQQYDQSVYLRVAEAQRCHVNCCLFLPVFATNARDRVAAVMEVVQTEDNERFAGLIDWAKVCLEGAGLWTIEAEGDTVGMGLRTITADFEASAFESKIDARAGGLVRSLTGAPSMPPPPPAPLGGGRSAGQNQSLGWRHPGFATASGGIGNTAEADDAIGGSGQHAEQTLQRGRIHHQQQPTTTTAGGPPLLPDRIVQIGNHLIISADVPLQKPGWQNNNIPNNNNNNDTSNGNLGSGSGGSSEPMSQPPISGVVTNPLAAANDAATHVYGGGGGGGGGLPFDAMAHQAAAAMANGRGGGGANGNWANLRGGVVNVPQGYATSYGHGDNAITLDDLSPHFHSSLRDAAAKMDISVTTLKRACRRLGLQRWPRRELASKANEASQHALAAAGAGTAVGDNNNYNNDISNNLFSWTSGQTISAGSSGEQHLVAAAAAAAAQQHMIRPPGLVGNGSAVPMVFVPGMDPPGALDNGGGGFRGLGGGGGAGGGGLHSNGAAMGDLQTQTHSLESLDILAAADVETFSVGNSPPGNRSRGGGGSGGGDDDDDDDDDVGGGLFSTAHMPGPVGTAL
jgi:RWP-RK domain